MLVHFSSTHLFTTLSYLLCHLRLILSSVMLDVSIRAIAYACKCKASLRNNTFSRKTVYRATFARRAWTVEHPEQRKAKGPHLPKWLSLKHVNITLEDVYLFEHLRCTGVRDNCHFSLRPNKQQTNKDTSSSCLICIGGKHELSASLTHRIKRIRWLETDVRMDQKEP